MVLVSSALPGRSMPQATPPYILSSSRWRRISIATKRSTSVGDIHSTLASADLSTSSASSGSVAVDRGAARRAGQQRHLADDATGSSVADRAVFVGDRHFRRALDDDEHRMAGAVLLDQLRPLVER